MLLKKLCLISLFLLLGMHTAQAFEFDIYQTEYKPYRLALSIEHTAETAAIAQQMRTVIEHDLSMSQSFIALSPLGFIAENDRLAAIKDYADWRIIGTDILTLMRIEASPKGWKVTLEVHDPFRNRRLSHSSLSASKKSWRLLAHRLANHIYQTSLGIAGDFDSHIVYVRKQHDQSELVYMDQDGFNKQVIGRHFTLLLSPDWSPDNRHLALNTYVGNRPRLEFFDLHTGKRQTFASFPGLNSTPEYAPDGRFIAASLSISGTANIHLYDTIKHTWKPLTHHKSINTSPTWSPDGRWIAFTSNRSGHPQIYRIRLSDKHLERVTKTGNYNTSASWSPDGKRIAFITRKDWAYALATIKVDGSDIHYLTTGDRFESPSWSPNSQMLLFSKEKDGVRTIQRIPARGGKIEILSAAHDNASDATWSRPIRIRTQGGN